MKVINANGIAEDQVVVTASVVTATLLSSVSATGRGSDVAVETSKTYTFEVFGTATSFTIQIEGKSISGTPYTLQAINLSTLSGSTNISSSGLYQVDIAGLVSIDANITAVAGGNVTVQGKLVS